MPDIYESRFYSFSLRSLSSSLLQNFSRIHVRGTMESVETTWLSNPISISSSSSSCSLPAYPLSIYPQTDCK